MNGLNNNLTILVVSYDGYRDMWRYFFDCKKKYWHDCPYETILANNTADVKFDNVRVINCGKDAQWSDRTRIALENINTKYVCFLLEDLFFSKDIDTTKISEALDLMEEDDLKYYKLLSFSPIRTSNYKAESYLYCLPENLKYGISLQAAIWEKDFFLKKIGEESYNPWFFEAERNREARECWDSTDLVGVYDDRNILNICHMVVQGKYLPKSIKRMQKIGIEIDTKEREVMPMKEYIPYKIKYHLVLLANRIPLLHTLARVVGYQSVSMKNSKR